MADRSSIEWTDATWNPTRGCTRVSQGCVNCYAETIAARFSGEGQPYEGLAKFVTRPDGEREARWTGKVRVIEEHLTDPLRWRKPRRIFVNSMSDLFHEGLSDADIDRIFAVMALAPQHQFQILTKRAERMRTYINDAAWYGRAAVEMDMLGLPNLANGSIYEGKRALSHHVPLPNVWLGVSVEDQANTDERIPLLLQTPAAVRFISAEPLLGPIDLTDTPWPKGRQTFPATDDISDGRSALHLIEGTRLDWVIVGGESGPNARPMHPDWARALRDQCAAAGVAFFFKQWGKWHPLSEESNRRDWFLLDKGGDLDIPDHRVPDNRLGEVAVVSMAKDAGRILDGRTHDEYPIARAA